MARSPRNLIALLAALGAIAALGLPALAGAGDDTGTDLGTKGGFNYRVQIFEDFAGPSFDSFVACLDGDRPISGGIDLEFNAGSARMGSTYPAQEEGFLWRSEGDNLLGGSMDMSFFAVCRPVQSQQSRFRSASKEFASAEIKTVKASCPSGFEVVGGGLHAPNPRVLATQPYDGKDSDHKPDDGWKVTALNDQPAEQDLLAFASCWKASSWDLKYLKETAAVGSDGSAVSTEVCTKGNVTGGGASIVGDTGLTRLHETYPADFGDADETPSDGWTGSVRNGSGEATTATFYAICKV